ncbi:MAG: hypothetical protein NZL93_06970, partial [Chthoniobacterales bacterium]|nr:hypothetical protein [Chthoniobacterales bacterium]
KVVEELKKMRVTNRFLRGMVAWLGFRQVGISYHREGRYAGESGYTLKKLLRIALDGITSFSIRPLRLASFFGIVFGIFCFVGIGWSLIGYF